MGKGREVPDILVNLMLSLLQKNEVNHIYKKWCEERTNKGKEKRERKEREKACDETILTLRGLCIMHTAKGL